MSKFSVFHLIKLSNQAPRLLIHLTRLLHADQRCPRLLVAFCEACTQDSLSLIRQVGLCSFLYTQSKKEWQIFSFFLSLTKCTQTAINQSKVRILHWLWLVQTNTVLITLRFKGDFQQPFRFFFFHEQLVSPVQPFSFLSPICDYFGCTLVPCFHLEVRNVLNITKKNSSCR